MDTTLAIIRRPVKHARLRVREDSTVQLVVPQSFDQALIHSLLQKKADWISRQQQFFRKRKQADRSLLPGEILLSGDVFHCKVVPRLGRSVRVDLHKKEIESGRDLTQPPELFRWYRSFARTVLTARARELSAAHRLPFNRLFIRSQRTKWGTCSTKSNISLNWRLVLAPKHVSDYVILHELIHTQVLNHSHRFWVSLRAICPYSDEAIAWLSSNSPPL